MTTMLKVNSSGGEQTVTVRGLRALLADVDTYSDVLTAMLNTEQADITLRGGDLAKVTFADADSVQIVLPPRRAIPPLNDFEAMVDLRFQISAHINCRAGSKNEARHLIARVLRNECHPPENFLIRLADEDVNDFMSQFDNAGGDPGPLAVVDHTVTDIRETMLITRKDTSL